MATMKTPNFEVPEQMREFAETSVDKARSAFDEFMASAQKAASTVEESTTAMQSGAVDLSRKAMSFAEENVANSFDFAQKMIRARDPQEILQLQTEFLRSQMTALGEQTRAMGEAATKTASDAAKSASEMVKPK
ncbi:MAG: phasin [Hyphomicrobiales bacterium]|nr:MAG: phasin [Hyphomicrobiales bacterium]